MRLLLRVRSGQAVARSGAGPGSSLGADGGQSRGNLTAYRLDPSQRPYEDAVGADEYLRYKWRGIDPRHADNLALRRATDAST